VNPRAEAKFFLNERNGTPARLRRRLTVYAAIVASSGQPFSYAIVSGSVTTTTEWAQLSPNYQQYRVRAIKATLVPKNFNNNGFAATVWFPGVVVGARYPSGSSAASSAAIWAEGGARLFSCSQVDKNWVVMATMADNPDAALFTDCISGAPPALSQFGVQYLGNTNAPAIYNGVDTCSAYVEFDVEFIARN
jgi:hypothetical protein